MAKKAAAPSAVFRHRVAEARKVLGLSSQAKLAERLREVGVPMHETAIARIESGTRRVTLDDAVAIAAALDVSPLFLFTPLEHDAVVELTPKIRRPASEVWAWVRGRRPLDKAHERSYHYLSPGDVGGGLEVGDAQELADWLARGGIAGRKEEPEQ